MKRFLFIITVAFGLLAVSCGTTHTRGELYHKMYEEKPVTILVMPPINNTTNVEAKDLLYTSISYPLIEAGYYVISPHLAMDMLKAESAYDAEMFIDKDAAIFGRVFGADAVIFSVIDKWQKLGTGIETQLHYIVRSTATNDILFERNCDLYLDMQAGSDSGLLGLAAALISTALTDHIVAARQCNRYIFSDLPRGKYHAAYLNDQEEKSPGQNTQVVVQ